MEHVYESLPETTEEENSWVYDVARHGNQLNGPFYALGPGGYEFKISNESARARAYAYFFNSIDAYDAIGHLTGEMPAEEMESYEAKIMYFMKAYKIDREAFLQVSKVLSPHPLIAFASFVDYDVRSESSQVISNIVYDNLNYGRDFYHAVWSEENGYYTDAFLPDGIKTDIRSLFSRSLAINKIEVSVAFFAAIYYTTRMKLLACKALGGIFLPQPDRGMFVYSPYLNMPLGLSICSNSLRAFIDSGMNTGTDFFVNEWTRRRFNQVDMLSLDVGVMAAIERYGTHISESLAEMSSQEANETITGYRVTCAKLKSYFIGSVPFVKRVKYSKEQVERVMSRSVVKM